MRWPWSSAAADKAETIINEGAEVRGHVAVKGPILILGRLEADARCEDRLVIGRTGSVRGNLSGRIVTIAGRVQGRVEADELVELRDTAHLTGEIHAPHLVVQEGAVYDGAVHMGPAAGRASVSGEPAPVGRAAVGRPPARRTETAP